MAKRKKPVMIFSGDDSREMWEDIDNARTIAGLRIALYTVGCRCQELEAVVRKLEAERGKD